MTVRSLLRRSLLCCSAAICTVPARASPYRDAPAEVGIAVERPGTGGQVIAACLMAAATTYRLPPAVLVILLNVEGGRLGRVSGNTNATVDIGPMQVNEIWLPEIARHWHAAVPQAFLALRDNFCANVEAGAYILRKGLDEARGDFWTGVGYYHSHDPAHKATYLRSVLDQAIRLQSAADRARRIEDRYHPPSPLGGSDMAQINQGYSNHSTEDGLLLFVLAVLLIGGFLFAAWWFFHPQIAATVIAVQHWLMTVFGHFTDRYERLDEQVLAVNPARVTIGALWRLLHNVGGFLRWPAAGLIAVLAVICLLRNAPSRFTESLDLPGLMRTQALMFRSAATFVERGLGLTKAADKEPRPADPALHAHEWIARFASDADKSYSEHAAASELVRQLGPAWNGVDRAAPHVRALFAVFALHAARRRDDAMGLLGDLSESLPVELPADEGDRKAGPAAPLSFPAGVIARADTQLAHPALRTPCCEVADGHAYTATALMSVLSLARERAGVLAPAQFAFLKLVDRRLWYALHSLGFPGGQNRAEQPNPRIEAVGARDHWAAECDLGRPLTEPSLERALAVVRAKAEAVRKTTEPEAAA